MSFDFNIDEILEMAEQIEANGAEFYRNAAERSPEPGNKNLLLKLANMEDQHKQTFSSLRTELSDKEKEKTVFDPGNDTAKYLKALADSRVFFEKTIDTSSMEGILKEALKTEKDSILFYLGMKNLIPHQSGKNKIGTIIYEEMNHVSIITDKLTELTKK